MGKVCEKNFFKLPINFDKQTSSTASKASKPPKQQQKHQGNQLIRNRVKDEIVENKTAPKQDERRYPKRGARKCYKEQEVPDEDHFLCKLSQIFVKNS